MIHAQSAPSQTFPTSRAVLDRADLLSVLLAASPEPFGVAIVSPQAVMRYGLRQLVLHHVGGAQLVTLSGNPSVVVYDLAELDQSSSGCLADLVSSTQALVIAVSLEARPDLATVAVSQGVDAVFSIGMTEDEWLEAVGAAVLERSSSNHVDVSADSVPGAGLTDRAARRPHADLTGSVQPRDR